MVRLTSKPTCGQVQRSSEKWKTVSSPNTTKVIEMTWTSSTQQDLEDQLEQPSGSSSDSRRLERVHICDKKKELKYRKHYHNQKLSLVA